MNEAWASAVIGNIALAVYVAAGKGKTAHENRPYHGFVLNDENGRKDYHFSDGSVMHTRENEMFYLPKGSSYEVKSVKPGGCYAINFDADASDVPFSVKLRNVEPLQKSFRVAVAEWKAQSVTRDAAAMVAVYEAIYLVQKEKQKAYRPEGQFAKLAPAVERLSTDFADSSLTVAELSELCHISEVYFRKIFMNRFGVSPKEYIIQKRIEYAKQLLATGQFSVKETAELCGYSEPCQFSREFAKRVGRSPKNY